MGEMKKREEDEVLAALDTSDKKMDFDEMKRLAKALYFSGHFGREPSIKEGMAKLLVKILKGRELGLSPVASVSNIYVVDGKACLESSLIGALIKKSGRYRYVLKELTNRKCVIAFLEKIEGQWEEIGTSTFDVEDAELAGLTGKSTYKKYPRNMLFARALSNGARWFCPDVLGGAVYLPDEVEPKTFDEPARPLEVETASPEAQEVTKAIEQQPEPETITVSVKERAETVKAEMKPEFRMAAEAFTPPPKKAEPKPEETQTEPPDEPSDEDLEERARELFPDPDEKPEEEEVDW